MSSSRIAVVTGGAGGIGGAIVAALEAAGHGVRVLDREQCDLAGAADVRRAAADVVSDTIWQPPSPALLAYVTSKAALVGLTRALAAALGADGVTVNAVAPGLTRTPAAEQDIEREAFEDVRSRQALPRALVPDDVAATVAFLCTDAAQAITGQTLHVDGGLIFH